MFELLDRDGFGRRGRITTPHGTVATPALLPVVHPDPARQTVPPGELKERFGFEAVITSSYILRRNPSLRERAEREGLHRFLGFPGAIMTDSGAFQQHGYGDVETTPEEILRFQGSVGSDIATVLDEFVEPEAGRELASKGVETTLLRAREARVQRGAQLLAVPVQGGLFPDLRARSAAGASELGDVLAVGGIVPLMERYRFADLASVLSYVRPHLAPERPVHLFGLGHPMLFALGALFGGDLFDSSSYHKFAERDTLLFPEGSLRLEDLSEEVCGCALCAKVPLLELRKHPEEERRPHLARHNLEQCRVELARVRQAIRDGELWDLAERRSTGHPALAAALKVALAHADAFLPVEPVSRRAFQATMPQSLERPAVVRFRSELSRWRGSRPSAGTTRRRPLAPESLARAPDPEVGIWDVITPMGPVPLELIEVYPAGTLTEPGSFAPSPVPGMPGAPVDGAPSSSPAPGPLEGPVPEAPNVEGEKGPRAAKWVRRHVEALLAWSFGAEILPRLPLDELRAEHSRSTRRLRRIFRGKELLFIVGNDGLARPTFGGAGLLREALDPPRGRVVAQAEAVPFVAEGRSLFSRHVARCDPAIAPGASVLVVDASDRLLAVGRALLAAHEMARMRRGVAVRVVSHALRREPDGAGDEDEPS